MKVFVVNYSIYNKNNTLIKSGIIKVKNRSTEFEAKCSLETFLSKKYGNFNNLVIHSCTIDNPFGDLFGKDNPFGDLFGKGFGGGK